MSLVLTARDGPVATVTLNRPEAMNALSRALRAELAAAMRGLAADESIRAIVLTGAAMVSAFMVSYTRAKAESLGFTPGTGMANVGLAPREVRIVILTLGLLAAGILGTSIETAGNGAGGAAYPLGVLALELALGLIAVLATITVIQRIVVTINQASRSEQG